LKQTLDYLRLLKFYFSNFVNKITIIPIEINANPRRDHKPIVRMNCDSLIEKICKSVIDSSSTSKFLVFAKNDTREIKINPTIKKIIPIPNLIFPPFMQSAKN
jgi:hypothetical protein